MNQKTPPPIQHEFIRKHKRKLSPKHKQQQLYNFKNPKPQQKQLKKEEIPNIKDHNELVKNQSDIVLDLKYQLSFLKQQMAKIVHSKLQATQNDTHTSKHKLLDYYFPKQDDNNINNSINNNEINQNIPKTSTPCQSQEKTPQMKKLKSKERLKFSKIKKSDKFAHISPSKKVQVPTQPSQNVSLLSHHQQKQKQNQKKNQKNNQKIPNQNIRLSQELHRISQRNRKALQLRLKSMVWEQQENIDVNESVCKGLGKDQDESKDALKVLSLTPQKDQKPAVYELKITRLKKRVKQLEQELDGVKGQLNKKSVGLIKIQTELEKTRNELSRYKQDLTQTTNQFLTFKSIHTQTSEKLKFSEKQVFTLRQQSTLLQHKLKNRQYEILKLQKMIKNHQQQFKELEERMNKIVEGLKAEVKGWKESYQRELEEKGKIGEELKRREKLVGNDEEVNRALLMNKPTSPTFVTSISKEQAPLYLPPPGNGTSSPRSITAPTTAKQKEYLSVIKMHQKSIQNYQKDLNFLEAECKSLHHYKNISKKQQLLLKEVNQMLVNEQLTVINAKYEKKLIGGERGGQGNNTNNGNGKDGPQIVMKRLPGRSGHQHQQQSTG